MFRIKSVNRQLSTVNRISIPNLPLPLQPLLHRFRGNGFRSFEGIAQSPVPAKAGEYAERAAHTKENGIEFIFHQAEMNQQGAAVCIHIRPGVFYFSEGL